MARQVRASRSRAVPDPPSLFATVALDRADEVVQRPPQPREFRVFPRRQLVARPWQMHRDRFADATGTAGQADHPPR